MGKGDSPRRVNKEAYDEGYERVFGTRSIKRWEDAPTFGGGRGDSGGQVDGLPPGADAEDDPETSSSMEGKEQ